MHFRPLHRLIIYILTQVSDEYVLRVLINSASIETILLAETRRDGDDRLQALGSGLAWTNDAYTVERFRYGFVLSSCVAHANPSLAEEVAAQLLLRSCVQGTQGTNCSLATMSPPSAGQVLDCSEIVVIR